MTTSEIITIGDELVEGSRPNTNATWLAKTLTESETTVKRITTVRDDLTLISNEIRRAVEEVDILITTGGLGPTPDDKTLKALSKAFGAERQLNEEALEMVKESYTRLLEEDAVKEKGLTPARKKMARLPENSVPIANPVGGAPAVLSKHGNTNILCLPGVPEEMKPILKQNLEKLGIQETEETKNERIFEIRNIEESSITPAFVAIERKFSGIKVRSYPSGRGAKGKIKVKLVGKSKQNLSKAEKFLKEKVEEKEAEIE